MAETGLKPAKSADHGFVSINLSAAGGGSPERQTKIAAGTTAALAGPAPVNILIVDDEPRNLAVLEAILDEPGYRLVRAESAEEALLALLVDEFAVLILDIRMPGVTGFELAQIIKERKKTANVPIIFLTAYYNEDQHEIEGYDAGAVDYLHKPVNPGILRSKVGIFVELYRKQRDFAEANRALLAEVMSRRRAEEQLRELNNTLEQRVADRTASLHASSQRLRAIYDGTFEFMWLLAPNGSVLEANRTALEFADCALTNVAGKPFWDTPWFKFTPGAGDAVRRAAAQAAAGEQQRFEMPLCNPAGDARTVDISFRPLHDERGRVILIVPAGLDVTERKRNEERITLLLNEVDHRSKNILSVVQAIAKQTAISTPGEFLTRFSERLQTLAASHDLLVRSRWQGVEICALIRAQLAHFEELLGSRIKLDGPSFQLSVTATQTLGMIVHELATNAAKYGALSNESGKVEIGWDTPSDVFTISWKEDGGPSVVAPNHHGFGSIVVKTMAESSLDGDVDLDFAPTGLHWRVVCPASSVLDKSAQLVR